MSQRAAKRTRGFPNRQQERNSFFQSKWSVLNEKEFVSCAIKSVFRHAWISLPVRSFWELLHFKFILSYLYLIPTSPKVNDWNSNSLTRILRSSTLTITLRVRSQRYIKTACCYIADVLYMERETKVSRRKIVICSYKQESWKTRLEVRTKKLYSCPHLFEWTSVECGVSLYC